ncbi:trigger factor [Gleimia sp. 6138-11-ORH1]|uniref:trigger factor n=1 Tax=Gleimia sp. 6138-11-ORH1 TaxID=2973937 RepID=UPI002168CB56|nr:trigger factor [Gleimia sp. 6138-11-ORH1]MCS4484939.1 trigger factor [Gleimia sp. 6138-11-ORH1]
MKNTVENLESTKVKLTVEVPAEELKQDIDAAYKELANQVNVPGFRRGKVPARIIDQRFGRAVVLEQVVNNVLPRLYSAAIVEHDLRPMGQPEVDVTEIPATEGPIEGQLVFTATVDVVPAFDIPALDDVEIVVDASEVTEADVDKELEELQTRFATLKPIKRKAKKGDFATLDMVAVIDGEEVDNVSEISYEIGSNSMLAGMDKALTGMKADEETTFTTVLAGGEHAGEEAEVTLKVTAMKTRELPTADDDFAQMVSEFDTIEELREDLKTQAATSKKHEQALQARDLLVDKLIELSGIEVPAGVVASEVANRVGEGAKKAEKTKATAEITREIAAHVLSEKLASVNEVQVGQQELFEFIMQTAQMYNMDPMQLFGNQEQIQAMAADLTRTKAVALALAEVTVKDSNGEVVDLSEYTRAPGEEAEAPAESEAE